MEKYILMNKNTPIVEFEYNTEQHYITKITDKFNVDYAPLGSLDYKGNINKSTLNNWWEERAIPISREHIDKVLKKLHISNTLTLSEKNYGLSLSDRYWINDVNNQKKWKDINFFDNVFSDELGMLTLSSIEKSTKKLMSPNSTLGGDIEKMWTISDNKRVLVKSGKSMFKQEIQNELIATKLYDRLLNKDEFVTYYPYKIRNNEYVACNNMLKDNEELIPMWDIIKNKPKPNHQSYYDFVIESLKNLGLKDVENTLSKMFVCDFIIANRDRHYGNFGVIRDVETLECKRIAPIYDSGNSVYCWAYNMDNINDIQYMAKPFGENGMMPKKQLDLFKNNMDWLDTKKLYGFTNEVSDILSTNKNIPINRIDKYTYFINKNIEYISNLSPKQSFSLGDKQENVKKDTDNIDSEIINNENINNVMLDDDFEL